MREHHGLGVVDDDRVGDAAEMLKGLFMAGKPLAEALPREGHGKNAARVAQRHHEDLRGHGRVVDPHAHLAKIDLRLLAWRCLEAHRRGAGPCRAEWHDRPAYNDY